MTRASATTTPRGPTSGNPKPSAELADNDNAVGQVVEAMSQSVIGKKTAIFIVEDDAQDGPDHMDCHRLSPSAVL
jgi:hypothetical protein